jgi:hypothetical protein
MTRQMKAGPRALVTLGALVTLMTLVACSDTQNLSSADVDDRSCSINASLIQEGGPGKDGIPALTNPTFVQQNEAGASYVRGFDRVAGILIEGEAFAIPLNIFWWHEIVNLEGGPDGATHIAVTHCPLTGSTMAFDRDAVGGVEFGVSGLLYLNNLIMYDRASPESLWPQMLAGARCGDKDGTRLPMFPLIEMSWAGWKDLHPGTWVISSETGWSRNYQSYPYGGYAQPDNTEVLFQQDVDTQRPPKERVLGVPLGNGGLTFPFGILDELGPVAAVQSQTLGQSLVVLWDREKEAAMAFEAEVDGETLTFSTHLNLFKDDQTQTIWRVDGLGVEGPLAGVQLKPVAEAFIAYWFAWPAFYPEVEIWTS